MSNKRSAQRQRRRFRVNLGGKMQAFTADLSHGGFSTEMMHVPPPGSPVRGTLSMGTREFAFTGQVSWAKAGDARMSVRGRFGVRFTTIDEAFHTALDEAFPGMPK